MINDTMKTIAQQLNVSDFPFKIRDKAGRVIYRENSNADWARCEYDSAGNQIYYENSDGFWSRREYDSEGNEIYYEDSDGDSYKYEYDSEGKVLYFEHSNGIIRDNRPKGIITLNGMQYKRIDE